MVKAFVRKTEHRSVTHENDEFGWLEAAEMIEVSPASLWALDDESCLRRNVADIKASETEQPHDKVNELTWVDSAGVEEDSRAIHQALDDEDETTWWSKPDIFEAPEEVRDRVPEDRRLAFGRPEADPCAIATAAADRQQGLVACAEEPTLEASSISAAEWQEDASEEAADSLIVTSRLRVLDESAILPHEASFATVALYNKIPVRSSSPTKEFVRRSTSTLKRLFPVLLLLAVCSAAIIFALKFKFAEDIFNSPPAEGNSIPTQSGPQAKAPTAQTHQANVSASVKPVPVTGTPGETARPPLLLGPVRAKVVVASEKSEIQPHPNDHKGNSATNKDARLSLKHSITTRNNGPSPKIRARNSPSKRASEKRTEGTSDAEGSSRKLEAEPRAVPSGGGERPRRVRPDSQVTPSKPKVIDWP